jgi:hypothetical protein
MQHFILYPKQNLTKSKFNAKSTKFINSNYSASGIIKDVDILKKWVSDNDDYLSSRFESDGCDSLHRALTIALKMICSLLKRQRSLCRLVISVIQIMKTSELTFSKIYRIAIHKTGMGYTGLKLNSTVSISDRMSSSIPMRKASWS